MPETWGITIISAIALLTWLAVALKVHDERAPYVWLAVLASVTLVVTSLVTYADVLSIDWARWVTMVFRGILLASGVYALWYVTRREP